MKRFYSTIRESDAARYEARLNGPTPPGVRMEACGFDARSGYWAILSHPVRSGGRPAVAVTDEELDLLRTLADCSLNTSAAARELEVTRNTVQWRINALRKRTGLDPLNFYDLNELLYLEPSEEEQEDEHD